MSTNPPGRTSDNRLLAVVAAAQGKFLEDLEFISLDARTVLFEPDELISHVYFPTDGVVSMIAIMEDGLSAEVATIGNEGMVGVPVFLGGESMPMQAVVPVTGHAYRMRADDFRSRADESAELRDLLHRYTQALFTQVAQSAVCNRLHPMEERCARWLLMTHDRAGREEFGLTHEFLAEMLGVRRATVSVAAAMLQRAGLISYRRGRVRVLDRMGLESASCECYVIIRHEYERLLG